MARFLRLLAPLTLCSVLIVGGIVWLAPAEGGPREDAALKAAQKKGEALYRKKWTDAAGAKTCATCHDRGPKKLTTALANSWPKYDRPLRKVATLQEKINQMIKAQGKGEPLELGSEELTALEAYLKTR